MKLPLFLALGLFIFALSALAPRARAEYRVFQIQIVSADGNIKSFTSTLDPDQYLGYYPVKNDEKISYTATWMCKGRTGDSLATCENPKPVPETPPSTEDRSPASLSGAASPSDKGPEQAPAGSK